MSLAKDEMSKDLAINFALNKEEWYPWFSLFAKKYKKAFIEQFDYFNQVLSSIQKEKHKPQKNQVHRKLILILNYLSLFRDLRINSEKEIEVSENRMNQYKEASKEESLLISQGLEELKNSYPGINESIKIDQIHKLFNFVINFYRFEDTREEFFLKFILDSHQENIMAPLSSQSTNSFYRTQDQI